MAKVMQVEIYLPKGYDNGQTLRCSIAVDGLPAGEALPQMPAAY